MAAAAADGLSDSDGDAAAAIVAVIALIIGVLDLHCPLVAAVVVGGSAASAALA